MTESERGQQLERKLWSELEKSPFVMLGFCDSRQGEMRPMTARIDGRRMWFFGSKSDHLVGEVEGSRSVVAAFASKGHDLFAAIHGRLVPETDPATLDRLWEPSVSAWYEKGRDDPEIALVRFETEKAELWEASGGSLLKAAYHRIAGSDPVREVADKQHVEVIL